MNTRDEVPHFVYRDMDYFFRKKRFFGRGMKERNVYAIFPERHQMEEAIHDLQAKGFANDDIFVTVAHKGTLLDSSVSVASIEPFLVPTGIMVGLVLGGIFGWLAQAGIFSFFGIEPFLMGSALESAAASSSVGGFLGGIIGVLAGLTFLEYDSKMYETSYPDGTLFLVVRAVGPEAAETARSVLNGYLTTEKEAVVSEELAA